MNTLQHRAASWLATAILLAVPVLAAAQPGGGQMGPGQMPPGGRGQMPPPGMGPGMGPMWQGLVMRLDLSDQQRAEIKSLLTDQRESERTLREQMRAMQQQLAAAVYASAPDTVAVADLVGRLAEAQRQALDADVALQLKVSALLSEAQRAQLLKMLSQGPPRGGPPPQR